MPRTRTKMTTMQSALPLTNSNGKVANGNGYRFITQQSLDQYVWRVCDVLRRSNCAGALQYVPELTWMLFLRLLDEREESEAAHAAALGVPFTPSLDHPFRWRDWAAPDGDKRRVLVNGPFNSLYAFVNGELFMHLRELAEKPNATPRQKVIGQIMSSYDHTRVDTETNLLRVLDMVHEISYANVDPAHIFIVSRMYEGLLLRMGEKGNDGGQFFTPRIVVQAIIRAVNPQPKSGATVYDPACGTGGFLAEAFSHMLAQLGDAPSPDLIQWLKLSAIYGREKENLIYPIALANLVLHGIDQPNLWHGNTLTNAEAYDGLFQHAPTLFDYVFTNPPFGGKEGRDAQQNFDFATSATQVLFVQHILQHLARGGTCGIVLDEGVLFRTNETAFVQTKRKLLDECDVWCIVSLPAGVFSSAGAGVKTNLLFFTRGKPTESIWYYDLSDVKVGKKTPLTLDKFEDFFTKLPSRAEGERSWRADFAAKKAGAKRQAEPLRADANAIPARVMPSRDQLKQLKKQKASNARIEVLEAEIKALDRQMRELNGGAQEIEDAVYDLKAVNPNAVIEEDTRTPEKILALIEAKNTEVAKALAELRRLQR